MPYANEIIFLILLLLVFGTTLAAFRFGGAIGLLCLIACEAVLLNIFVVKQLDLFGLSVTGGNIMFGGIFLATDLLNEKYGPRLARLGVLVGFASGFFMLFATQLTTAFLANAFDTTQTAFQTIFALAPRIVLASFTSFLIVQLFDVWFFNFLRQRTQGKALWLRNNLSTMTSQIFDTLFFTAAGLLIIPSLQGTLLAGFLPAAVFWQVVGFTLTIKIGVTLLDTPILYLAKLKCFTPSKIKFCPENSAQPKEGFAAHSA